ncbi:hypothetical protein BVX98_07840, partial [bacterium F11]
MKSKLETFFLTLLIIGFLVITIFLLFPRAPISLLFSLYLVVILATQGLEKAPVAYMMTGFCTLLGVFCLSQIPESEILVIPILLLTLWGCVFLLHYHLERVHSRRHENLLQKDERLKRNKVLRKEIDYYINRKKELLSRANQRRQLAKAARELGSLLDPQKILEELIETAQHLFPKERVFVSYGQNPDAIDRYIIQRRQPILVPGDLFKGDPLMAVPFLAHHTGAGILRVGGKPGKTFAREEIRPLYLLGSLGSLSLVYSVLFNQVFKFPFCDC